MTVRYERDGAVARVVLDRPDRLNALNQEMKNRLIEIFRELRFDHDIRAVLLTAEGRAFCAGSDVGTMTGFDPLAGRDRIKNAHQIIMGIADLEKPVIAAVRGATVGIGWSLALACDWIIASDTAKFSQVFKKIGLAPDGGAIYFLTQYLGVLRAKELVMSARMVAAEEALRLGLVTELVPDAELDTRAFALAQDLAASATFALGMGKRMFRGAFDPPLETFLELESHVQNLVLQSRDHKEGVSAFMEKRTPGFVGR